MKKQTKAKAMSKQTKAKAINHKNWRIVHDRDNSLCIKCGTSQEIEVAHYIRRSQNGLGIPENLGCLCHTCHVGYDSAQNEEAKAYFERIFREHLERHYPGFPDEKRVYHKP